MDHVYHQHVGAGEASGGFGLAARDGQRAGADESGGGNPHQRGNAGRERARRPGMYLVFSRI